MKRIVCLTLILSLLCSLICSCSNKDGSSNASGDVNSQSVPQTDEEWHEAMIEKSLTSYGNTSAMQEKIKKAQSGETVTIAYIGGSITEGMTAGPDDCWAKLTYNHFSEKYGTGDNVKYVNAGLSGTPSTLGNLRLQRDVLSHNPDICFVEFAVNDANDADHNNSYESIVRTLLENDVAVVLLFSVTEADYSCQDYMKAIGNYYDLPMISYCDALRYMFENKQMTWKDFSDDQSHPNVNGHALVAEMVNRYFDTVTEQQSGKYVIPEESFYSDRLMGADILQNTNLTPLSLGSWEAYSSTSGFTNGWSYIPGSGNKPIVFKFTAQYVYLIYKEVKTGNFGKINMKIKCNGELYDETEIDPVHSSGWGNPEIELIGIQDKPVEYEIEITMDPGEENGFFDILGFGYIK